MSFLVSSSSSNIGVINTKSANTSHRKLTDNKKEKRQNIYDG